MLLNFDDARLAVEFLAIVLVLSYVETDEGAAWLKYELHALVTPSFFPIKQDLKIEVKSNIAQQGIEVHKKPFLRFRPPQKFCGNYCSINCVSAFKETYDILAH